MKYISIKKNMIYDQLIKTNITVLILAKRICSALKSTLILIMILIKKVSSLMKIK